MSDPIYNKPPGDHHDPLEAVGPTTIGVFTDAAQPAGQWTVTWHPVTSEVTAARTTATANPPTGVELRTLARVPTATYVNDVIEIVKQSRDAGRADQPVSFDDLAQWLTRLDHALADTSAATVLADTIIDNDAFYVDHGHRVGAFDPNQPGYSAPELWGDLAQSAAHADQLLQRLVAELHDDGNLASAAAQASELAIVALAMHIALQEAYSASHWSAPDARPRLGRTTS